MGSIMKANSKKTNVNSIMTGKSSEWELCHLHFVFIRCVLFLLLAFLFILVTVTAKGAKSTLDPVRLSLECAALSVLNCRPPFSIMVK